jgi:two-component system chemotaxis response regulator CheB
MSENVTCRSVGIILTGMGQDGAAGLLAMRQKGAFTIGQDKESSVVYGMPGVANEIGAVQVQASCGKIADVLLHHLKSLT